MTMRVAHMALRVENLDSSVQWFKDVMHLEETLRDGERSYLTCNDRHHELILIGGSAKPGYDHMALEVGSADEVEAVVARCEKVGGKRLRQVDDEPGIAGGVLLTGPGGHVFKIFHGMEIVAAPAPDPTGVRPERFEHISLKVHSLKPIEKFLEKGLGFEFSDRLGPMASWWHCESLHHGIAIQRAPQGNHLHHHAWSHEDFNSARATADILHSKGERLVWGPGRHGPGNNTFIYFKDPSGALIECCTDLATFPGYQPKTWPFKPSSINFWGGTPPPLKFIAAGTPVRHS